MENKREFYMGIDIESGSPLSKENHKFFVIIIDNDLKIVNKIRDITLSSLIRLAWEWKPKAIAIDNVFEIAKDEKSLSKILSLLPPQTQLVQVTINDGKFADIKEIAKQINLEIDQGKLTPSKTAYLAAVIALKGKGTKISFSNEKTQIIVSKGRWSKSGGMSQNRYQRRIRASVNIAANKIKDLLERSGIDYDMFVKKGEGGIDSAIFTVYTSREKLYGIVRPHKGIDYSIAIKSIYDGKILFGNNLDKPDRPIIVGIDPGITTGIAIIDLEGNVLYLDSKKEMDRGDIISLIYSYGKPILLAVDVDIIPDMVKKLASQINAEIYVPREDMLVVDKSSLALKATGGENPDTTHERDALASAYKAFLNYKSKLSQVESYVEKIDIDLDVEKIKADVIRGITIADAIDKQINEMLNLNNEEYKEENNNNCNPDKQPENELISKIQKLEAEKITLENKVNELIKSLAISENEVRSVKQKLKTELLKDEEIKKLKNDVSRLNSLVNELEENINIANEKNNLFKNILMKILNNEMIIIKRLQSLKMNNIKKVEDIYGKLKEGDVILIEDQGSFENDAINYIIKKNILAIIVNREDTTLSELLKKKGIPVLNKNDYNIVDIDIFTFAPSTILKDASMKNKELKKSNVEEIDLRNIIDQYRKNKI
ncbi:hypothetical protein Calag_1487 [Caldisphaera lagunensis DSM 15908]|uniref:DUF460 domain-containing protein n=1 Tax=Caldisphaera lagunensis (strain DSM 15908 / JCM 11604 / ANMR 0165 / IC-154) TaxID=1056495 RepID=L0ACN6_CALLD|nr:DUF460 domain-containing protein [Caldisphaera lagunensis]AFZ71189.1 hypothetical protein Calag_1487 [Caldisphaera lagunensis DSM 15908]